MSESELEPVLQKIESLLKDRFKNYLVVATDGDAVFLVNSTSTSAIGLARYAILRAESSLMEADA